MPTASVEFTADIKAGAEKVWDILTDVKSWLEWRWTSYIEPVPDAPLEDGATFIAQLGGLVWDITITKADKPNKVSWLGRRMGIEAIHEWEFFTEGDKTRVVTRETMSGWMVGLIYPILKSRLAKYDEKWLADLKSKAENI